MTKLSQFILVPLLYAFSLKTLAFIQNENSLHHVESSCSYLKPDKVKTFSAQEMKKYLKNKNLRIAISDFLKLIEGPKQIQASEYLKAFLITRHPTMSLGDLDEVKEQILSNSEQLNFAHDKVCQLLDNRRKVKNFDNSFKQHLDYLEQKIIEFSQSLETLNDHLLQERINPFLAIEKLYLDGRLKGDIIKGDLYNFEASQLRSLEQDLSKNHSLKGIISLKQARLKLYRQERISRKEIIKMQAIRELSSSILGKEIVEPFPIYEKNSLKNVYSNLQTNTPIYEFFKLLEIKFKACQFPLTQEKEDLISQKFLPQKIKTIADNPEHHSRNELLLFMEQMIYQWNQENIREEFSKIINSNTPNEALLHIALLVEQNLDSIYDTYMENIILVENDLHRIYLKELVSNIFLQQKSGEVFKEQEIKNKYIDHKEVSDSLLQDFSRKFYTVLYPLNPLLAKEVRENFRFDAIDKIISNPLGEEGVRVMNTLAKVILKYKPSEALKVPHKRENLEQDHQYFLHFLLTIENSLDRIYQSYMKDFQGPIDPFSREKLEDVFFTAAISQGFVSLNKTNKWIEDFVEKHKQYGLTLSDINSSKFSEILLIKSFSQLCLENSLLENAEFPEILLSQRKTMERLQKNLKYISDKSAFYTMVKQIFKTYEIEMTPDLTNRFHMIYKSSYKNFEERLKASVGFIGGVVFQQKKKQIPYSQYETIFKQLLTQRSDLKKQRDHKLMQLIEINLTKNILTGNTNTMVDSFFVEDLTSLCKLTHMLIKKVLGAHDSRIEKIIEKFRYKKEFFLLSTNYKLNAYDFKHFTDEEFHRLQAINDRVNKFSVLADGLTYIYKTLDSSILLFEHSEGLFSYVQDKINSYNYNNILNCYREEQDGGVPAQAYSVTDFINHPKVTLQDIRKVLLDIWCGICNDPNFIKEDRMIPLSDREVAIRGPIQEQYKLFLNPDLRKLLPKEKRAKLAALGTVQHAKLIDPNYAYQDKFHLSQEEVTTVIEFLQKITQPLERQIKNLREKIGEQKEILKQLKQKGASTRQIKFGLQILKNILEQKLKLSVQSRLFSKDCFAKIQKTIKSKSRKLRKYSITYILEEPFKNLIQDSEKLFADYTKRLELESESQRGLYKQKVTTMRTGR